MALVPVEYELSTAELKYTFMLPVEFEMVVYGNIPENAVSLPVTENACTQFTCPGVRSVSDIVWLAAPPVPLARFALTVFSVVP